MLILGNVEISWFAVFTAVSCFIGMLAACVLRSLQKKDISDIFICVTYGVPLGLLFGRLLYIFFSSNSLTKFSQYINLTNGGFGLYGVMFGVFLAAVIAVKLHHADGLGSLLDVISVAGALAISLGRFATGFASAEIGYQVSFKAFTVYDEEQGIYNLAVYKLDGIYEAVIFLIVLWFFMYCLRYVEDKIASGKTALLMLALHGTNQVVMDSMRADPLKLGMNEFIKISQILGITCCVFVLAAFMILAGKKSGFGKFHLISLGLIGLAIFFGVFGEYRVGSSNYISNHLIMFGGMVILDWLVVAYALMTVDPDEEAQAVPAKAPVRKPQKANFTEDAPARNPVTVSVNRPENSLGDAQADAPLSTQELDLDSLVSELKNL